MVGMPGVRYANTESGFRRFRQNALESFEREQRALAQAGHRGPLPPAHFLALSGGGDNGAFGVGLLNGWTESGTRPEFKVVTGVSTGALIASLAFLGAKYDEQIRTIFTGVSSKDVLRKRTFLAAVLDDAMADNRPLRTLTEKYVTGGVLRDIAAEYAKGRLLLIGTTNLDAHRGIIWNIGKIAESGHPKALDLLHNILLASSAVPGAFPPVLVEVEAQGQRFQEMHVDGGASAQVFVYPPQFKLDELGAAAGVTRVRKLYVIRNAQLDPGWSEVERRTLSIAGRAIASLIQAQGRGDLFRLSAIAQRDQVDFNLAYIPSTFKAPHREEFDNEYMRQLFQVGYDLARKGYPWAKTPPGM